VLRGGIEEALRSCSVSAYPDECCGLLAGRSALGGVRIAEALFPLVNAAPVRSRRERFAIDGAELRQAEEAIRRAGLAVVGLYHSHPDREAHASEADRRGALPGCSYLIIAVRKRQCGNVFSWVLEEGSGRLVREDISIAA